MDQAAALGFHLLSGVPRERLPDPGSMAVRFGQAEPYCVRWETDKTLGPEFAEFASGIVAALITRMASQVWRKRAKSVRMQNTDGDPMLLINATISVRDDATERLLARPDFVEEDEGEDDQIVWWGERVEPLAFDDEAERWVLGHLTPGEGQLRVRVNSRHRLRGLMRILTAAGLEPQVTEEKVSEPSVDFAWGPVPGNGADGAGSDAHAREWETNWLDQAVTPLNFRTPRQAVERDEADALRVEGLLRQLEYQAALATTRGERAIDVAWLRAELDLGPPQNGSAGSSKTGA